MFGGILKLIPKLDRKALTPADAPWFAAAAPTASGVPVSVETALKVPAVSAAIRSISEAAASLPCGVTRTVDGVEAPAPDHPVSPLITNGPNAWSSWFDLIRDLLIDAQVHDRGATAWANRVGGEVRELIRYNRAFVSVDFDPATDEPSFKLGATPLAADDVVFIRAPLGRAPLTLAREAIGLAAVQEQHASRLFGAGGRPGGVLEVPGKLSPESAARIRGSWQAAHGGAASGGTAVLEEGVKFAPITLTSVDAQFLELRTFQINEIARAFRVPPGMLYEMSRQTWSNMEQASREFLVYSLEPWLLTLEGALNRALFTAEERKVYRLRFDRDDLSRADLETRAAAINSLVASQVLNPDEGRDWLGLGPRPDGEGGRFFNPNISPAPASSTTGGA